MCKSLTKQFCVYDGKKSGKNVGHMKREGELKCGTVNIIFIKDELISKKEITSLKAIVFKNRSLIPFAVFIYTFFGYFVAIAVH